MSDCKAQKPWKDLADCWEAIAKRHKKTIAAQEEQMEQMMQRMQQLEVRVRDLESRLEYHTDWHNEIIEGYA